MPIATRVLLDEHARIRAVLGPALQALPALETGGRPALAKHMPALRAWAEFSAGGLAAHAAKEDEILFPAVERYLGTTSGPTQVMRHEHQAIHALGRQFAETLTELRDRHHPALAAEVRAFHEALQGAEAGSGSPDALLKALREMTDLLQSHFAKEEQILFPLTESLLPPDLQQELGEQLSAYLREV